MPRLWLVISTTGVLLAAGSFAFASTAIMLRHPRVIVLAADTKGTGGNPSQCKIALGANAAYLVVGLVLSPREGFDAYTLGLGAVSVPGSIRNRADNYVRNALPLLRSAINRTRATSGARTRFPQAFGKGPVHEIVIAGVEQGQTAFAIRSISVTEQRGAFSFAVKAANCPDTDCSETVYMFGQQSQAAKRLVGPRTLDVKDFATIATDLVAAEIDAKSDGVGPPIDVLRLSTNEPWRWVARKSQCPEVPVQ